MFINIKRFLKKHRVYFEPTENIEDYVAVDSENNEIITFYCSSNLAMTKLIEILIYCNYNLKAECSNCGGGFVAVEKETEKRIAKLKQRGVFENHYFKSEIFM